MSFRILAIAALSLSACQEPGLNDRQRTEAQEIAEGVSAQSNVSGGDERVSARLTKIEKEQAEGRDRDLKILNAEASLFNEINRLDSNDKKINDFYSRRTSQAGAQK